MYLIQFSSHRLCPKWIRLMLSSVVYLQLFTGNCMQVSYENWTYDNGASLDREPMSIGMNHGMMCVFCWTPFFRGWCVWNDFFRHFLYHLHTAGVVCAGKHGQVQATAQVIHALGPHGARMCPSPYNVLCSAACFPAHPDVVVHQLDPFMFLGNMSVFFLFSSDSRTWCK